MMSRLAAMERRLNMIWAGVGMESVFRRMIGSVGCIILKQSSPVFRLKRTGRVVLGPAWGSDYNNDLLKESHAKRISGMELPQ